jgi:site-specific recombinase XerD
LTNQKVCDILELWGFYAHTKRKILFAESVIYMTFREIRERQTDYYTELKEHERAAATIRAYRFDIEGFFEWATETRDSDQLTREDVIAFKESLQAAGAATSTINRKIISLNKYLKWAGAEDAAGTKQIKQQRKATLEDVISRADYERLCRAAIEPSDQARKAGMKPDLQMWALMNTIAGTGIRFNELQYFTVESLTAAKRTGTITVTNKGKQRAIPVSKSLNKLLTEYCNDMGISSGYIFGNRNGKPLRNEQVAKRLKRIAGYARVRKSKVHPHNFRHLFAKEYMEKVGRLDKLQDILGHADISTTTIYTKASSKELAADTESLDMIQDKPKRGGGSSTRKGKGKI